MTGRPGEPNSCGPPTLRVASFGEQLDSRHAVRGRGLADFFPSRSDLRKSSGWGVMRTATLGRSFGPLGGVAIALLLWGVFTPQTAYARCSHYARPETSEPGSILGLELLERIDALSGMTPLPEPAVPSRPTPCSGAMCSGLPAVPSSSASPEPQTVGFWAILTAPDGLATLESVDSPFDEETPSLAHSGCSVFHPPRP